MKTIPKTGAEQAPLIAETFVVKYTASPQYTPVGCGTKKQQEEQLKAALHEILQDALECFWQTRLEHFKLKVSVHSTKHSPMHSPITEAVEDRRHCIVV